MAFETLNVVLSAGTIAIQLAAIALGIVYSLRLRFALCASLVRMAVAWALWIGFVLTLSATLLSLYYSEVLHFLPCGLCWVQRVFLYPQVVLFGVALWKSDRGVAPYALALSVAGGIVALYQHYLQMGGSSLVPCPATGAGDCAQRIIFEFGYVTFPLMAFSLFVFVGVLAFVLDREARH